MQRTDALAGEIGVQLERESCTLSFCEQRDPSVGACRLRLDLPPAEVRDELRQVEGWWSQGEGLEVGEAREDATPEVGMGRPEITVA